MTVCGRMPPVTCTSRSSRILLLTQPSSGGFACESLAVLNASGGGIMLIGEGWTLLLTLTTPRKQALTIYDEFQLKDESLASGTAIRVALSGLCGSAVAMRVDHSIS